ncbi:hypothetical protein C1645_811040 [Glomus cerebriforme]|uniref:Uncharacterized protein n=1 Tax=Glomus cerebriforme TaxID=658196 RepID=A0A397TP11_9GLOM|nr:hypothetical protein C1645_811040 [Glomus cerebriforme]
MTTIELYEYFRRNVIRLQADAKNEKAENIQNEVAGLDEDKLEQYKPVRDPNEISKEYEKRQKDIPLVPLYRNDMHIFI